MGASTAVQWWDEWQLRVLVLGSLGVQFFLAFFSRSRKSRIPDWFRFSIWLSFLGSDALAIYALATLFNLQKRSLAEDDGRGLEVLWAPVLLMHLGGQAAITAYNIEDNELWKRHIVTAVSQITVAVYVFCKSWPSSADKRLLAAAVLLFIPGAAKCFEKPLSLMRSSLTSLSASINYADNYSFRLTRMKCFCLLDDKEADEALTYALGNIFDYLYTKATDCSKRFDRLPKNCLIWTFVLSMTLPIVSIGLVHKSLTKAYTYSDVNITFVLLYGTLLLEFISGFGLRDFAGKWPAMVAQHNLIGSFARDKRRRKLTSFGRRKESCSSSKEITKLVRQHAEDGWKEFITDSQSYREFNSTRGQWTLERKGCTDLNLAWVLQKPFDESIICWHVATDFCFYHTRTSLDHECARRCREISNYMVHLLHTNHEMLLPGSRKGLLKIAYDELDTILIFHEKSLGEEKLAQKVIGILKSTQGQGIIRVAWMLAESLTSLGDENKMWEVIQGVWVEMLCFSAGRCRGYLHAKSLGTGGEYLSYVWLLLANTGMETFSQKLQRTQTLLSSKQRKHLENQGEGGLTQSTSQAMDLPTKEGNFGSSSASQDEVTAAEFNEFFVEIHVVE
ncbi:hypothetical protein VPH35_093073 [Triticum aestivum]